MFDDDFFDLFPDMDMDGDHDIVDFFICDEIDAEIQREIDESDAAFSSSSLFTEDRDIDYDSDIDPYDFDTEEEYLEAVAEENESAIDFDDYETLDEDEDPDEKYDSVSLPLSFSIEVSYPGKEQLEKIKETNYPNKRTYDAAYALCEIEYGDPYIPTGSTKEAEAERHKFVLSQSCVAARYLTIYDGFIFVQAVKDHFHLPIDVPDEDEEVNNNFQDFLMELAEEDVGLALDAWVWCVKEFGAYQIYMQDKWSIYNGILSSLDDYPDEFNETLIDRLESDSEFRMGLLCDCPDMPYSVDELITHALTTNREKAAQVIFIAVTKNPKVKSKWKEDLLNRIISQCSNWEELETMELFQKKILPIAEKLDDKRIQRVLPKMVKKVEDYISEVESSEKKYQFSRRFAWRAVYAYDSKYGIDPLDYETEQEYLLAIEKEKYGWRYDCKTRLGVSPYAYETKKEYDEAVEEARERETRITKEDYSSKETDTSVYRFCKVSLDYPYKPHYYYFVGELSLNIGDCVAVPFGRDNDVKEGVVMSVGECYGCALPCSVDKIKYVERKIEEAFYEEV